MKTRRVLSRARSVASLQRWSLTMTSSESLWRGALGPQTARGDPGNGWLGINQDALFN